MPACDRRNKRSKRTFPIPPLTTGVSEQQNSNQSLLKTPLKPKKLSQAIYLHLSE